MKTWNILENLNIVFYFFNFWDLREWQIQVNKLLKCEIECFSDDDGGTTCCSQIFRKTETNSGFIHFRRTVPICQTGRNMALYKTHSFELSSQLPYGCRSEHIVFFCIQN